MQYRLTTTTDGDLEYLAKDTRKQRLAPVRYLKKAFVATLIPHVVDRYRNSMRHFGSRAGSIWQEELEAALPNTQYREINFTMPKGFWAILEQNRHLLHDLSAIAAAAIEFWARARYGVRVILMVVQNRPMESF
jgi:hypothetical protein